MQQLGEVFEQIQATPKRGEKINLVGHYLRSRPLEEAAVSALFLCARPFPVCDATTLQVGASLLWNVVSELSEQTESQLVTVYRRYGDMGAVAESVLRPKESSGLTVLDVERRFRAIAAASGARAKRACVRALLAQATPREAKYLVKIMTGDLRIGLKEALVEEAIAQAYAATLPAVQRANLLLGDIGETLRLASARRLDQARLRLFHPLGFMLASPAESAKEALSYFAPAQVEDKYDGIRAQAHCSGGEVKIYSRTRGEITQAFPEIADALAGLGSDAVLDGEILAWRQAPLSPGQALPFSLLQQRLGRKTVSARIMRDVPVAYLVFDVLYAAGELLLDHPLRERTQVLERLLSERTVVAGARAPQQATLMFEPDLPPISAPIIHAPALRISTDVQLEEGFAAAQARGNEGLVIKDPDSIYTPGRRGKSWLKMKRELASVDAVITEVEYGHGKRIGVLSDYTFAVWDQDRLLNIGKAYSGLSDVEIAQMSEWFLQHTTFDHGLRLEVEPKMVVEIAFNNIMRSTRHASGYALRFPRIVRLRPDKSAEEADTIERVKTIYEAQHSAPAQPSFRSDQNQSRPE